MLGTDRNGKKSCQGVLQEVLGGLLAAPLSAAARMKTNGAARLSSQAEKHHVPVALTRLSLRRHVVISRGARRSHTAGRAVSQRRRVLVGQGRRAAVALWFSHHH